MAHLASERKSVFFGCSSAEFAIIEPRLSGLTPILTSWHSGDKILQKVPFYLENEKTQRKKNERRMTFERKS